MWQVFKFERIVEEVAEFLQRIESRTILLVFDDDPCFRNAHRDWSFHVHMHLTSAHVFSLFLERLLSVHVASVFHGFVVSPSFGTCRIARCDWPIHVDSVFRSVAVTPSFRSGWSIHVPLVLCSFFGSHPLTRGVSEPRFEVLASCHDVPRSPQDSVSAWKRMSVCSDIRRCKLGMLQRNSW